MKLFSRLTLTIFFIGAVQVYAQTSDSNIEYSCGSISIGLIVKKPKKALEFYTEVLGMVQTGGFSIDREFGRKSGLSGGKPFDVTILKTMDIENATELKLLSIKANPTHPNQKYIQDDTGVQYLTFFVKSLDPILPKLKKARVKLLGKSPVTISGGRFLALIQDPDGTFVELIGPMTTDK